MAISDQHQFHPGSQCWCGGAHGTPALTQAYWTPTTSTWSWPSTTYTLPEFSDSGYEGRHRA